MSDYLSECSFERRMELMLEYLLDHAYNVHKDWRKQINERYGTVRCIELDKAKERKPGSGT